MNVITNGTNVVTGLVKGCVFLARLSWEQKDSDSNSSSCKEIFHLASGIVAHIER